MIKFREYFNYVSFGSDAVVTTKLCNYLLVLIIVFFLFFSICRSIYTLSRQS